MYFNLDSIANFGDLISVDDIYVGFSSSYNSVLTRATSFIKNRTSKSEAVFLPSGRSAVYIICKYLVEKNKSANIILPGYTCSVVASAALSAGIEVRYCDVEADGFKLDKKHLAILCDNNTDAVLIQHIFGFAENVDEIKSVATSSIIVEDCAHSFGIRYIGEKFWTGTKGDVGFFSFDHTKAVTCLGGGCLFTDNSELGDMARLMIASLKPTGIWKESMQFIRYFAVWRFNTHPRSLLDKVMYKILVRMLVIRPTMTKEEKNGKYNFSNQTPMSKAKMGVLLSQFVRLRALNEKRKENFRIYNEKLGHYPSEIEVALRYAFVAKRQPDPETKKYFFRRWFNSPLHPVEPSSLAKFGYQSGMCPNAEVKSKNIVNLPTGPRIDATQITKIVGKL